MNCDILYLSGSVKKETGVLLSIESYISLFVYKYCDFLLEIRFLDTEETTYACMIPLKFLTDHKYEVYNAKHPRDFNFLLPAVITEQGKTIIAGLCAVLRWAIKAHVVIFPDHYSQNLLGFRGGCLVACTENSIWTRFCELQLPNTVNDIALKVRHGESITEMPENFILLEEHLKRPVRTHNILKRKLDIAKKVKQTKNLNNSISSFELDINFTIYDQNCTPVDRSNIQKSLQNLTITEKSDDFCLDHCYLEGIDFTLADMIVFPCVHYLLNHLPFQVSEYLKNVTRWYNKMCSNTLVCKAAERIGMTVENSIENCKYIESAAVIVPDVNQLSLYKRDPIHTKLKCKHQNPEKIISFLSKAGILPQYNTSYCTKLNWNKLPPELHPANGDLPQKRLERKCQQLESIVTAVLKIAKENQSIVEFCSGGGHVGLLLAYYLPSCKVILIENKEFSMLRAKQRALKLGLKNVFFYQCNLDYFKGSFDIGVSLHACGVATDLVIQQCIEKRASFVCCPCCYGNIQDTHLITYPLSKKFSGTDLSKKDYMLLAHFADRNETNTPTAENGEVCMGLIDSDRTYYAEEQGYKADLTLLQPITCSPKHNLLIGISPPQIN